MTQINPDINYQAFIEDFVIRIMGCCRKYNVDFDDVLEKVYYNKYEKETFKDLSLQGLRLFVNDHPEILEGKWILSIAKRIAGQMYTHHINNTKVKANPKKEAELNDNK